MIRDQSGVSENHRETLPLPSLDLQRISLKIMKLKKDTDDGLIRCPCDELPRFPAVFVQRERVSVGVPIGCDQNVVRAA